MILLSDIFPSFSVIFCHIYANDIQLYLPFKSDQQDSCLESMIGSPITFWFLITNKTFASKIQQRDFRWRWLIRMTWNNQWAIKALVYHELLYKIYWETKTTKTDQELKFMADNMSKKHIQSNIYWSDDREVWPQWQEVW